jgi:putative MATE family efflux protein
MLKEALLGTHQDFTEGQLNRAIILLAIPMILEMVMESLFGAVDVFFVARLGANAVATVGLTESLLTVLFAIAIGLSMSTTAFVARRIGEKDAEGAAQTAVQSIFVGLIAATLIAATGVPLARTLLAAMGATPAIEANARYTQLMLGGNYVIFMLFLINAIFRGAGDAALAMRTLWFANAINIVLDPCLINGWGPFPRLGVFGAAVATTTGRGMGVLFQLWQLRSGKNRITIRSDQIHVNLSVMWRLLRVSSTGITQFLIGTASWIALVRIISTFGSAAIAGYTIAIRIVMFTALPAWGLSGAAATLVGQNLGAKKPERAETSVYRTGVYAMGYMGLVSIAFLFFPERLAGFFTSEPGVASASISCLSIFGLAFLGWAWGIVMLQAFNGAGDTVTPTLVNLFAFWIFQLPLAYLLGIHFGMGLKGAFSAVPVADSIFALLGFYMFRRGAWKLQRI